MTHNAKLMFVAAQNDDMDMDLFVHATDFLHAVRLWKVRFAEDSGWDWPNVVVVFNAPPPREPAGVVEWRTLHHIEINPRDVV